MVNNRRWKGGSAVWEAKGGAWDHAAKGGVWEGRQGKGYLGKGGIGSMECLRRVVCRTEEAHGKQHRHPSPGLELQNSFGALGETDSEEEIPLASFDAFPFISREFECKKKMVTKRGQFKKKTQKQKKEAQVKSQITSRKVTTGGLELHPLVWVEDIDDQLGLHAVSDCSRWMSVCPMTGFVRVKSVLDSGATDSCAPDCMCPEVKSRLSEGSRRGQMYTAAGGKKIANEGEKDIPMVTGANEIVQTNWETVDITRPLSSVRQILLAWKQCFSVLKVESSTILRVDRRLHLVSRTTSNVLDLWLPPSPTRSLGRQG